MEEGQSSFDNFDKEVELLLKDSEGEGDESEKEETAILKRKKSKRPFKRGDIVWKLLLHETPKGNRIHRMITEDDLKLTRDGFREKRLELRGSLCVVRSSMVAKKVGLCHVHDGLEEEGEGGNEKSLDKDWERVPMNFVHFYQPDYSVNQTIMNAIFESMYEPCEVEKDWRYLKYVRGLKHQYELVKDFIKLRCDITELDPLQYLVMNSDDRRQYLSQLQLERKYSSCSHVPDTCETSINNNKNNDENEDANEDEETPSSISVPVCDGEENPTAKPKKKRKKMLKKPTKQNLAILDWFSEKIVEAHLKKIMRKTVASERHDILVGEERMGRDTRWKLLKLSNASFLDDDGSTEGQIYQKVVNNVYEKTKYVLKAKHKNSDSFKMKYVNECLIPEGIILYLKEKKNFTNQEEAEKYFVTKIAAE